MNLNRTTIISLENTALAKSIFKSFIKKEMTINLGVASTIQKAISKTNKLLKPPFNLSGLPN